MKPYYYVLNPNGQAPKVKHPTLEIAQREAERIAAFKPGVSLEILKCVGIASCSKASTFWMDGEEPKEDPPAIRFFTNPARDIFWMIDGKTKMIFREWFGEWQHTQTPTKHLAVRLQPIDESSLPDDAREKLKEIKQ
jgi:hypothetical protein